MNKVLLLATPDASPSWIWLGLTPHLMAQALEVSPTLYAKVEAGDYVPSPKLRRHMTLGLAGRFLAAA